MKKSNSIAGTHPWGRVPASVFAILVITAGCDIPQRPPIGVPRRVQEVQDDLSATRTTEVAEPPKAAFGQDWESWDAYYLQGEQVGYSHLSAAGLYGEAIRQGADTNVQYTLEDQLRIQRGSASYIQHLRQTSTESSIGVLLDFESTLHVGPIVKQFRGLVEDKQLKVETVEGGQRSNRSIDWQSPYRGLVAVQQSLRRKPMIAGERRMLKALSPIQYGLISVEMFCSGEAAVPMIDGEYKKLREIATQYVVGPQIAVDQTIWTDAKGEIQKTLRSADGLTSFRTDKDTALAGSTPLDELLKATRIDVIGEMDKPEETTRAAFLIRPSPAMVQKQPIQFDAQPGQYVLKSEDGTVQILVTRSESDVPGGFQAADLKTVDNDLTASRLIDYKARHLSQLATVAGKLVDGDQRQLAIDLAGTVRDLMSPRRVSRGLMRASEIANTPEGGCLEHAVFLAAMLRAREIPARLALGFVYEPGNKASMSFHVWNLAHANDQWVSLDPVLGSLAPANRITLATTNLSDVDEYSAFKTIMNSLGQFVVEIKAAEY